MKKLTRRSWTFQNPTELKVQGCRDSPGCTRFQLSRKPAIIRHPGHWHPSVTFKSKLESRRRRTKGSVVGEEWCQNAAPLRWYTKNVFAQSKMILSRAWLHDTVSCAAGHDARKGVYLKGSNCYWGWSKPIVLDYRDISRGGPWPRHPWELNPWPF